MHPGGQGDHRQRGPALLLLPVHGENGVRRRACDENPACPDEPSPGYRHQVVPEGVRKEEGEDDDIKGEKDGKEGFSHTH